MKSLIKLFSSTTLICAVLCLNVVYGKAVTVSGYLPGRQMIAADIMNSANKLRVVFIPKSTYKNFNIGIESAVKTDVNIQVINHKGLVVYSNLLERVSKKLEQIDFSFLKAGQYTVKVTNQESEFSKTLVIP